VAVQELGPVMAETLERELGGIYPYRNFSMDTGDYGMAVLSRYPMTELQVDHLSNPNWRVQALRIQMPDGVFILYNIHLPVSNVLAYWDSEKPFGKTVQESFRAREAQMRDLALDIATRSEPVVVAGDFNSTDRSDVHRILSKSLTDAHQAVGWGFGHTFPAYSGSWKGIPILPKLMRLDMVFYSEELTAIRATVGSFHGESDHLPVLAELAWGP
jgi:endonuclease/exonuclease/phosphatase (EEP) superfamily protein YafD